ncbi:(E,E)-alpha-farnesene synthase [Morus notabilis]|uniref:(E,E)-alpha-farnesene synthase n=1 Tax=Morus notabilis TaxID=981085 RepID=W9SFT6_9ROSA|nr:alpha-farnesene synthase [Morus notabilis]EXC71167.1 (E,E)-alpha-farnesene synthase [Morus notabilis]
MQKNEYRKEAEKLIQDVKDIFIETEDLQAMLKLIDSIRKLGLTNHFEEDVKKSLDTIASTHKSNTYSFIQKNDLYLTSLCFRVLRQQGYQVSQDIFCGLMDGKGVIEKSLHIEDIRVMLELLEASHVALESENILHEAKAFITETLRNSISSVSQENMNDDLSKDVVHALKIPSHWRVQWFDVKWQMEAYERDNHRHICLLDLAKLNFNTVQATLQKDLRELSW